jgi:hypothetical protein
MAKRSEKQKRATRPSAREAIKRASRQKRWQDAVDRAIIARDDLDTALSELVDLKSEFEDWRDNTPENLHGSPLYEKLDAVCDLEIDRDAMIESVDFLDEADGMDLPLGFGRD